MIAVLLPLALFDGASADEAGVSFWLQGQFGSFAAAPSNPGWSFESTFYHATAAANPSLSFVRGGGFQAGVKSPTDFVMVTPTYVFATPILGAQAAIGMTALYGRNTTSVSATLTGPGGVALSGSRSDDVLGFGDLYPAATLKWNQDVHNFMLYATAGAPVGVYDPTRLASMGLGHWATDAGVGYTYLNEQVGFEWSAVVGFTYNFINPYTQYRSGIDAHLDWAISPYLTEKLHIGAVGYVYNQVTGDSGAAPRSAGSDHASPGSGRRSGFSFQSRIATDTSISEPIPSSTPRTGSKDGPHTSRSPSRQRNASQVNSGSRGPSRFRADAGRGRRAGFHPPRAIATPTSAAPIAIIR